MHQRRFHVLVADERPESLHFTVDLLKRRDHVVAGASNMDDVHWWLSGWPIDLLVVDDGTLDGMKHAARPFTFGAATCLIPSVEHLIAMKLHAPVDMILAASAAMLPIWNADPQREATRLAEKCRVRFALGPRD